MHRLALIAILLLVATPAAATFEISDPANELLEEVEDDSWMEQGEVACKRYVKNRRKQNSNYLAAIKWLVEYSATMLPESAPQPDLNDMTRWIDAWCLEQPDEPLSAAARAYLEEPARTAAAG